MKYYLIEKETLKYEKMLVKNEYGETIFQVRESMSFFGSVYRICRENGDVGAAMKRHGISILPYYKVEMAGGGAFFVKRKASLYSEFTVKELGWEVTGDPYGINFRIFSEEGNTVARITRKPEKWKKNYEIEICVSGREMEVFAVAVAVQAAAGAIADAQK